jgi:ParB-like chromosome segregation protein Spo0J
MMKPRQQELRDVPLALLDDNPLYPTERLEADPDQPDDGDTPVGSLKELEETIRQSRIIDPLTVAPAGDRFVLLDGHRRLRVARTLGLDSVQCLVVPVESGEDVGILFVRVQAAIAEERPWPWSEVDD